MVSVPAVLLAICTIILMVPMQDEKRLFSILCSVVSVFAALVLPIVGVPEKMVFGSVMFMLCVYIVVRILHRFNLEYSRNFKIASSMRVRTEARAFYTLGAIVCGCLYLTLIPEVPEWILDILVGAYAMLLLFRAVTGRTLFVRVRERRRISTLIDSLEARREHHSQIYDKVVANMEKEKPYVTSRLTLEGLAKMVGVSRTDLSQAVNSNTNGNFCQFVNSYRVEYAKDVMTRDPYLKVTEAGRLSGFQSESAFTPVFKRFTDMTPSEFMRHARSAQNK